MGLCGFVCLSRRFFVKILASVKKFKYPCSGILSLIFLCAQRTSPQDNAAVQNPTAFMNVHPDLVLAFELCIAYNCPLCSMSTKEYTQSSKHTSCKYVIPTASLKCIHWVFYLGCKQAHKRKFVLSAFKYDEFLREP